MSYEKEAEEVCEKIRQIVCLDNPPDITPEQAVSDFMTALFEAKDKEIAELRTSLVASEKKMKDQWEEIGKQSGRAEDLLKKLKASEAAREKADADIKEHEKLNTELLTSLLFTKQRAEKAEKDLEERIADWTLQWGELSNQLKESRAENSRLEKELAEAKQIIQLAEVFRAAWVDAKNKLEAENSRLRAVVENLKNTLCEVRHQSRDQDWTASLRVMVHDALDAQGEGE